MTTTATPRPRILVAGAGLAGLVAARHLAAAGADVTLVERREAVGGRVRTRERDGFRFDRGFQVLFTAYPAVRRELELDALDRRRFSPGATIVDSDGRSMLADPRRAPTVLPATASNPHVSAGDAIRLARLWWDLRRTNLDAIFDGNEADGDDSIAAFLRERGFSDRFIENVVAPFYGGITLDRSLSTSKRVFEYTFRTLAAGEIAVPAAGMEAIPAQLADRVRRAGGTIETGIAVESVSIGSGGVTVETDAGTREVDAVVVATDPPAARELTGIAAIPTAGRGCVTQYYALPPDTALETGRRLLVNATERGPNHVVPHSAVAPEYAPDSATLISATYLGAPDDDDSELAERTRRALESWYPDRRFDGLEPLHTARVPFAQFEQPPGVHDRLPDARDPDGPIYLAGDYTRWSSIQGAMESGRRAAKAVIDDRSQRSGPIKRNKY